jgi:hypothetical protein
MGVTLSRTTDPIWIGISPGATRCVCTFWSVDAHAESDAINPMVIAPRARDKRLLDLIISVLRPK